ncbi:hypothetical protein L2E82_47366 [Cichorium intybus]|uniref:Uncharacterized protein n=1 Tax=Cichorium intybus TaxID=13427 RepID=A0ACB8YZG4_CICIN|nr:hypothetical protein L2E82_47366 [Cichorium intybus]
MSDLGKPMQPIEGGKELVSDMIKNAIPSPERQGYGGGMMVNEKLVWKEKVELTDESRYGIGFKVLGEDNGGAIDYGGAENGEV